MWVQEEPKNQGPWSYIEPRLRNALKHTKHKYTEVDYAGRDICASTATGYGKAHTAQLAAYLDKAMK